MIRAKDRTDALMSLCPGAEWSMSEGVITFWKDTNPPQPSDAELDAEVIRLKDLDAAEATRKADIKADAGRQDLMTRLKTATPAQIDTWIDNNVTNIASARAVLKAIIKVIALDARS